MATVLAFAPTLQVLIERARDKGVDPSARVEALLAELALASKRVFGADLPFEVSFDEASEAISAMACVKVGHAPGQATPEQVAAAVGPGFEEGDEVLIDVEHFDAATWSVLGFPDPERVHQAWLAESGRVRLVTFPESHGSISEFVAELEDRLELPALEWSLEVVARFLAERAPAARAYYAGAPGEELGLFRELGDATGELVRLLEKLGPSGSDDGPPFFKGSPLLTPERSRTIREMLDRLEANGDFGQWEPNEWWNPAWVPFFGDDVSLCCIDLQGWDGDRPGLVVAWSNDAPERGRLDRTHRARCARRHSRMGRRTRHPRALHPALRLRGAASTCAPGLPERALRC